MIVLPKIEDPRGNLSFIEHGERGACPFEIGRVAWIYDVPAGRGRKLCAGPSPEMIVAMSGSFDAGIARLDRSDRGLAVEPGTETALGNFSTNSVAMVLGGESEGVKRNERDESNESNESNERDESYTSYASYNSYASYTSHPSQSASPTSHATSSVEDCRVLELGRRRDADGSVTEVVNGAEGVPFDVRRVFYLYDVPADATRGGHSHHQARELIVALSGSFDVVLDDGFHVPRRFSLNRPYQALYIPTGLWRTLDNFSGGAVCLVLTSERYSEEDYVRDYARFKELTAKKEYEKLQVP